LTVKFLSKENKLDYVWATSWGVSTRLMGALIMAHSDDNGLVLPPKLAPTQVVIVPIYKNIEQLALISETANKIKTALQNKGISVKYDDRDTFKPGWKFSEYEFKGCSGTYCYRPPRPGKWNRGSGPPRHPRKSYLSSYRY